MKYLIHKLEYATLQTYMCVFLKYWIKTLFVLRVEIPLISSMKDNMWLLIYLS